jgi:hypothetical protein
MLFPGQHQPHTTSADTDAVLDCLTTRQIAECASVVGKLKDLGGRGEGELTGQGSLQILLSRAE